MLVTFFRHIGDFFRHVGDFFVTNIHLVENMTIDVFDKKV